MDVLGRACAAGDHEFWPCEFSVLDTGAVDRTRVHGPRQVTDAYLLALAAAHDGCFVTFDRSVPLGAVPGATAAHLVTL
jgi:predicted nucleic acid-binding protein